METAPLQISNPNLTSFTANCMGAFRDYSQDPQLLAEADAMFLNNVDADKLGAEQAAIAWLKVGPTLAAMLAMTVPPVDASKAEVARLEVYHYCRDRLVAMYVKKRGNTRKRGK